MIVQFATLEEMISETAATVRPPERLTVAEAAEKYRRLNNPGAYVGPWRNAMAPYLVEPQEVLTSHEFTGEIFVGPAQAGKTDMYLNWQAHSVVCDPADMMLIEKSQTAARDFSKRRIDRLHRHTPIVAERLVQHRNSDNVFDKQYSSGMMVTLSWPAINELSGKPIPRLWLTDYDRMPQDVDGEGNPFDLARKRATTFRRYGMTVAESSPGFVVSNSKAIPQTRHEAPPTEGILALYNRGDRRRWYWRCFQCKHTYEPDFSLLSYPDSEDEIEAGEQATMVCPHCGAFSYHDPRDGLPGKHEMNLSGRWVKDGMIWTPEGELVGKPVRSDIASFWLKGVAASFTDWKTLVVNYVKAVREFQNTGSEEALKTTTNTDQGVPYIPKSLENERLPEELKARAKDFDLKKVPIGVRFLVAAIDVQRNRFVVQVHGIGVGGDVWVVDRFDIRKSKRLDDDGERFWVNPGAYPEDWRLLVEEVLLKTYPLIDGSGGEMQIKMVVCDSGGEAGVTTNAYNFCRWLRKGPEPEEAEDYGWEQGLAARFILSKGDSNKNAPRVRIGFPDAQRKDRHASARGDIPVLFFNPNSIKDTVNHKLDRKEANGGRISFPSWLPDSFYTELTVEVKTTKGWENPKNFRNESWDLLVMNEALCISTLIGIERFRWDSPPGWAEEWDSNDLIFDPEAEERAFAKVVKGKYDLADLARTLA